MNAAKHERIIEILEKHNLDALLIQQICNFAWLTDGASSYVNTAAANGVAKLLLSKDTGHLITDNIEAPRFEKEEGLKDHGWDFQISRWYLPSEPLPALTAGLKLGADVFYPGAVDLSGDLTLARSSLDVSEQDRFRRLSASSAAAMDEAIKAVKPGMTEFQIAALLSRASQERGILPIVNLIATDERAYHFRHPLPTDKVMEKYAMLVLCGRQAGLVCSLTRFIHFGALADELKKKAEAVASIDAAMIAATRPGKTIGDVFQVAKDAYAKVGFADEWQLHHQGGLAGYNPREVLATATAKIPVRVGQAYAWNPSITGSKSEDTILVTETGNEIMSAIAGWPTVNIDVAGQTIARPAILVVD